jgi:hypothetical protein
MNCIFCKQNSEDGRSIEHIIPESLGNTEHTLPKGIVCDKCNEYFAVKIEKEVLEQEYFTNIRHLHIIFSKKGKLVPAKGTILHPEGGNVQITKDENGVYIENPEPNIARLLEKGIVNKLYIPYYPEPKPNNMPLSRLIGKMAIEGLAKNCMHIPGWEKEITYKAELDALRKYVRYGPGEVKFWQYHQRNLYPPDWIFTEMQGAKQSYQVLHEYTFHYSEAKELFFIIAIMGIEYAINMGGPEIDTYLEELKKVKNRSFLQKEE